MKNVSYIGHKARTTEQEAEEEKPLTLDSLLFFAEQLQSAESLKTDTSKPQVSSLESLSSRSFSPKRKS